MNSKLQAKTTSFPVYVPLIAVFVLVLSTLNHVLMSWIWVLCGCAIVIAILRVRQTLPSIKNVTLNLLAIFCMLLLVFLASDFGLMATMVNLLVVAACLKLINMQSSNDYYLMLSIQVLLIVCGLVYHQSLAYMIAYFLLIIMLLTTAFIVNRGLLPFNASYKQSLKMIGQAIPITLALFIVAPRLPPFWQTAVDQGAQTGLSENLTPGDIANLAKTDDLVFRAEFQDSVPAPQQRYWRSIVLDYFNGKTWSIGERTLSKTSFESTPLSGENYQYLVMAEPNNTKWMYSLDVPVVQEEVSDANIQVNWQYQLYKPEVSIKASLYIVRSYFEAALDQFESTIDAAKYMQLPQNSNPRTREWIANNIRHNMPFSRKLNIINSYFTEQKFRYTLHPPLMPTHAIDAFLFDYQQGFCSHYASALTFMLRLSNIPARMVAGYQGGELESEKIISVRQYDAHAWVEAYDPVKGWIRLDPTALVAPNRALSGLMSSLSAHETHYFNDSMNSLFGGQLFEEIRKTLAIIDFNWNTFVLGFSQDSQAKLIEKLFGEFNQKTVTTFLLLSFVFIGLFLLIVFLPYKKLFQFEQATVLEKVLNKLNKIGYMRHKYEPLQSFYNRIEPQLGPELKLHVQRFIHLYYQLQYQTKHDANSALLASSKQQEQELDVVSKQILKFKQTAEKP